MTLQLLTQQHRPAPCFIGLLAVALTIHCGLATGTHAEEPEPSNLVRDPGEKMGNPSPYIWVMTPIRRMVLEHQKMMERFPNRVVRETAGSKMLMK